MSRVLLCALVAWLAAPAAAQAASFTIDGTVATLTLAPYETGGRFVIGAFPRSDSQAGLFVVVSQSGTDYPVVVEGCNPRPGSSGTDPFCDTGTVITRWILNGTPGDDTLATNVNPDSEVMIIGNGGSDDLQAAANGRGRSVTQPFATYTLAKATLIGGDGNDTLIIGDVGAISGAPARNATIFGRGGNDAATVYGGPGVTSYVDTGAGDDTADVFANGTYSERGGATTITGGDGADTISFTGQGGAGATINAGTGNDDVNTMLGPATIDAGPGNDVIEPDRNRTPPASGGAPATPVGPDVIKGGPGVDTLKADFQLGRTQPFVATLDDVADDGQAGEGDNYGSDLENIVTRGLDARITGTAGPNVITAGGPGAVVSGLGGNDTITGRGSANAAMPTRFDGGPGNDTIIGAPFSTIIGGSGTDTLVGSQEADRFEARDGEKDTLICGRGVDTAIIDPLDVLPADPDSLCETVYRAAARQPGATSRPAVRLLQSGRIAVVINCRTGAQSCRGTIRVRAPGPARTIATGGYAVAPGKSKTSLLSPSPKGKRLLPRRGTSRRVIVELKARGAKRPAATTFTLRR